MNSHLSYGLYLAQAQRRLHPAKIDYGFIEYLRIAAESYLDPPLKDWVACSIKFYEGQRDFHAPSLKQINHLIQIDEKPNQEMKEPKWELYKISISFQARSKFLL